MFTAILFTEKKTRQCLEQIMYVIALQVTESYRNGVSIPPAVSRSFDKQLVKDINRILVNYTVVIQLG